MENRLSGSEVYSRELLKSGFLSCDLQGHPAMIKDLKSWWTHVEQPSDRPPRVADARLKDLSAQLPSSLTLTALQKTWLEADLTAPDSFFTIMKHRRAVDIRGPSIERHEQRRRRLAELEQETKDLGFKLPVDFVKLLNDDESVNRLRFTNHWIELADFICRCPIDDSFVMVLFLCEEQGCDYTHLLLGPDGRHCVTRTGHWYGQNSMPPTAASTDQEKSIYHYADSFAEFVCMVSDEIRCGEPMSANKYMKIADEMRDNGQLDSAAELYELALSFDPGSSLIEERIASINSAK